MLLWFLAGAAAGALVSVPLALCWVALVVFRWLGDVIHAPDGAEKFARGFKIGCKSAKANALAARRFREVADLLEREGIL